MYNNACVLDDESRKINNASHEEHVPLIVAKADGKNGIV